jgi:hypothetical protein
MRLQSFILWPRVFVTDDVTQLCQNGLAVGKDQEAVIHDGAVFFSAFDFSHFCLKVWDLAQSALARCGLNQHQLLRLSLNTMTASSKVSLNAESESQVVIRRLVLVSSPSATARQAHLSLLGPMWRG